MCATANFGEMDDTDTYGSVFVYHYWYNYQQYYARDGSEKVSRRKVIIEDEEQLLKTFIVVWSMGFVWCFTLKWPHTIQSLFLRRCLLYEATHVGIFLKRTEKEAPAANKTPGGCFGVYDFLSLLFARASECIQIFMSLLFSDSDCYHCQPNGTYQICPVQREADYSRFLVLLFRRYNFDDESSMFVSGKYPVGETISDLQAAGSSETGLAATDVEQRLRVVGPNSIEMPKPVVWNVILHEFCKPFYTYQLFMIFSCTYCSRPTFILL
jgi:Cation transporter/ATPase, N-terminus